jgi:transposase-like protein
MPKKFPPEFKRDVVAVARRGGVPLAEVAADFDISESTLHRWMRQAAVERARYDAPPRQADHGESGEIDLVARVSRRRTATDPKRVWAPRQSVTAVQLRSRVDPVTPPSTPALRCGLAPEDSLKRYVPPGRQGRALFNSVLGLNVLAPRSSRLDDSERKSRSRRQPAER